MLTTKQQYSCNSRSLPSVFKTYPKCHICEGSRRSGSGCRFSGTTRCDSGALNFILIGSGVRTITSTNCVSFEYHDHDLACGRPQFPSVFNRTMDCDTIQEKMVSMRCHLMVGKLRFQK